MERLTSSEIYEELKKIDGWFVDDKLIFKEFKLKDFSDALSFLLKVGIEAEKIDHHPDLLLYGWNKIKVVISTHSVGGLTLNDFKLARIIDEL